MKNALKYLQSVGRAIVGRVKSVQLRGFELGGGFESVLDVVTMRTYKRNLYVYIAVSMVAKSVSKIEFDFYRLLNSQGDFEEMSDHEIIDLLNTPNSYLTRKEFVELSTLHYILTGDVFWYFERAGANGNGRLLAVHPLSPDYVEVVLNANKSEVVAYKYQTQRGISVLQPENVVHIKSIDPTNIVRGFGILQPARTRIVTEDEATNYQANFFKNQGRPDVAVFVDQDLNQDQIDDGRQKWQEVYGRGQGGQAGFFGKNVREVKMLNVTPREMDFIGTQSFLRDDILAAVHVPKAMVTSDDVNLANSKTARINYMQEAVLPIVDTFKDAINNRLLPRVADDMFVDYIDPTPEDRDIKLREATELKRAGILSANEARQLYGYDEVEGADTLDTGNPLLGLPPLVTQSLRKTAKTALRTRKLLRKRFIAVEKTAKMVEALAKKEVQFKGNPLIPDPTQRKRYAAAVNKSVDQKAKSVEVAVLNYYQGMLKRVLASAEATGQFSTTGFLDKTAEQVAIKNEIVPVLQEVLQKAGQEALDFIFTGQKALGKTKAAVGEQFTLTDALLAKYAERYIFFANSITDTNFEALKGTIMAGLANGDGVDVIGRNIRNQVEEMAVSRGKTIARTETGFAQSIATNEAYQQSSVVTGKQWITAGDNNVRDEHLANEAQGVIGKNETFASGEDYPAHRSINCRCVLAPALGLDN